MASNLGTASLLLAMFFLSVCYALTRSGADPTVYFLGCRDNVAV